MTPDAANNALLLHADNLPLEYNDTYNETMAAAVTLRFAAEAGVLRGYTASRIFTARMGVFLLVGVIGLGLSVLMFFLFRKKREIIPVVGLKAPQDMDPLRMGKLIDGTVNDEDITSMIYWFASKGYLFINFEDEKNPVLVRRVVNLPEGRPRIRRCCSTDCSKDRTAWPFRRSPISFTLRRIRRKPCLPPKRYLITKRNRK